MDIDQCAAANTASWQARAEQAVNSEPVLAEFRSLCESTLVGTNVTASKLRYFLRSGVLGSTYEYRAEMSSASKANEMFDSTLGQRRLAFETMIGCPRSVTYGTLDAAGVTEEVGDYR